MFNFTRIALALTVAMVLIATVAGSADQAVNKKANQVDPVTKQTTGIVTLYTHDPIAQTFGFERGVYGHYLKGNTVYNKGSDIDFGTRIPSCFAVGIEGSRVGTIIDIGSFQDLEKRYGEERFMIGTRTGEWFASIHKEGEKILIMDKGPNKMRGAFRPLSENAQLFGEGIRDASAPVKSGHIYLIRITDENKDKFQCLAKVLVLEHRPGESVTIRWQLLE